MSSRKATYITLTVLIFLGILYFISASHFTNLGQSKTMGPGYFPKLLSIILIILCLVSLIQTKINKQQEKKIEIHNLKMILATIALTALYFLTWYTVGYFYVITCIYAFLLINLFHVASFGFSLKSALLNTALSLLLTMFIYVVFDLIMPIPVQF